MNALVVGNVSENELCCHLLTAEAIWLYVNRNT
jgi:hypothetical protein